MDKITLRAARVNAGYTQRRAAELIGVSLSTVKNWEVGKSFPNQPAIDKICDVYRISYDRINFFAHKLT